MEEKELLRVKGERKAIALLEYYLIVVTDKRAIIGRTKRGHTKFVALTPGWSKYNGMTPEEILNADKDNFEVAPSNLELRNGLLSGEAVVKNKKGKKIKIRMTKGDFNKLKEALQNRQITKLLRLSKQFFITAKTKSEILFYYRQTGGFLVE